VKVAFPEGRKVKAGGLLTVSVETSKPKTVVRLCFNREVKKGERCYKLLLNNKGLQLRKIRMTLPRVEYRRP